MLCRRGQSCTLPSCSQSCESHCRYSRRLRRPVKHTFARISHTIIPNVSFLVRLATRIPNVPRQGACICRVPRNREGKPPNVHTLALARIRTPLSGSVPGSCVRILYQIRHLVSQRRVDISCVCHTWSRTCTELPRDTMEHRSTGLDYDQKGKPDVFLVLLPITFFH